MIRSPSLCLYTIKETDKKNEMRKEVRMKRKYSLCSPFVGAEGRENKQNRITKSDMVNSSVQRIITVVMLLRFWWLLAKKMLWI